MSNHLYAKVPGWVGPTTVQHPIRELLGGEQAGVNIAWVDNPRAELGCYLGFTVPGGTDRRRVFFSADGDANGSRRISTANDEFWRTVLGQMLRVVGGTMRSEYVPTP